jgi:hypothetical protein
MQGAYTQYLRQRGCGRVTEVVEQAKARHAEECILRRARIANNAEPAYKNGHPKAAEKSGSV